MITPFLKKPLTILLTEFIPTGYAPNLKQKKTAFTDGLPRLKQIRIKISNML